jgi:tRNA(Ile)-lysidine synthase
MGLSGIASTKDNIIRPMLCFSRAEIRFLAQEIQLSWREDASNQSLDYQRNKIRHQVIPVLEEINPALFRRFQLSARHIAEAAEIHRSYFKKEINKHFQKRHNTYEVTQRLLQVHPYGQTLLFEFLKGKGFHEEHVQQIFQMMQAGLSGKHISIQDTTVLLNRKHLLIYPKVHHDDSAVLLHEDMEAVSFANGQLSVLSAAKLEHLKEPMHAYLNMAQLQYPLSIRPWKKGDYFYPFGMNRKKKKVSDFLVDQKISMQEKKHTYVLLSGSHIAWVIGMRIDDRFRVDDPTKAVFHLKFETIV